MIDLKKENIFETALIPISSINVRSAVTQWLEHLFCYPEVFHSILNRLAGIVSVSICRAMEKPKPSNTQIQMANYFFKIKFPLKGMKTYQRYR